MYIQLHLQELSKQLGDNIGAVDKPSSIFRTTYLNGHRVAHMWFEFTALLLNTAFFVGFIAQLFLNLLSQMSNAEFSGQQFLTVFSLPGLIILTSLYVYYQSMAAASCFDREPFTKIRAYMLAAWMTHKRKLGLAVLGRDETEPPRRRSSGGMFNLSLQDRAIRGADWKQLGMALAAIDIWYTVAFDLFLCAGGLISVMSEGPSGTNLWAGMSIAGLIYTNLSCVVFILSDFFVNSSRKRHEALIARKRISFILTSTRIRPGEMFPHRHEFTHQMRRIKLRAPVRPAPDASQRGMLEKLFGAQFARLMRLGGRNQASAQPLLGTFSTQSALQTDNATTIHYFYGFGFVPLFFGGILLWVMSYWLGTVLFHDNPFSFIALAFALYPSILVMDGGLKELMPKLRTRGPYQNIRDISAILAIILLGGCSIRGFEQGVTVVDDSAIIASVEQLPKSSSTLRQVWQNPGVGTELPYPICSMQWGSRSSVLNVLDVALLAAHAYVESEADYTKLIDRAFHNAKGLNGVKLVHFDDYEMDARVVATYFNGTQDAAVAEKDDGTVVVAVKGTSTPKNVYTDMGLYAVIAYLGVANFISPVLEQLPNTLYSNMLALLRLPVTESLEDGMLWHVAQIILQLKREFPNAHFVITGHSLGGGVAEVLGAQMLIPSLVFSAPGAHFMRYRFHTNRERQFRNVVGVQPMGDVVPTVDRHDDMVQHIECLDKNHRPRPTIECHLILTTICELWRACGDPRQRDFGTACSEKVNDADLGSYFGGNATPTDNTMETKYHFWEFATRSS